MIVETIRVGRLLRWVAHANARIAMLASDYGAAEREFLAALAHTQELDEREPTAQVAAGLARALHLQGRLAEAADMATLSLSVVPEGAVEAGARARAVAARAASAAGDNDSAERLARQAADDAPQDMPNVRADVLVDLAVVLRSAGREKAAMRAAEEALRLYEGKGNIAGARSLASMAFWL